VSAARAGAAAVLALVALDLAGVPAVLPSARVELGTSTSGVMWVQEAYLLGLAVPLLLLGTRAGGVATRAFAVAGIAAFAAGALLAAGAAESETLVLGRALQGVGTAMLAVPALATLSAPRDGRRGVTPVALAGVALIALAVAPALGGGLAEKADWRWLFRIELVPAVIAAFLLYATPARREAVPRSGALALGLPIAAAGLIQGEPWGWGSADTLLLLAAGGVLLTMAWRERPGARSGVAAAVGGGLVAVLVFAPQYFELARGLSPLRSGLLTVAVTGPAAVLAALAAPVARRRGSRLLLAAGLGCAAIGALGATRIDAHSSYALVVLSLALLGAGGGTAAGALAVGGGATAATLAGGAALVFAAAAAVFQHAQLDERDGGASFEEALAAGLARSSWLLAALLAVAAVVAWRRGRGPAP
jgi:MFS family permease